jgi:hypothetical protein
MDDNIKMDIKETGWEDVEGIQLTRDRTQQRDHVNTVAKFRVP